MEYDPALYDLDPRSFLKDEVDFYRHLIEKYKVKTTLELGVGTGRIISKILPMVNLAVGIDISEAMLYKCGKVCEQYNNYELYKLDFIDFNLHAVFDLVYLPFNTFQHLLSEADQIKCLKSVLVHMNDAGRFILDVMNGDTVNFDLNHWKTDYSCTMPDGEIIERTQKTLDMDPQTWIIQKVFKYTKIMNETIVNVQEFDASMKITPNKKLQEILYSVGFEIEDIWFDYFFNKRDSSHKMIYCLKTS